MDIRLLDAARLEPLQLGLPLGKGHQAVVLLRVLRVVQGGLRLYGEPAPGVDHRAADQPGELWLAREFLRQRHRAALCAHRLPIGLAELHVPAGQQPKAEPARVADPAHALAPDKMQPGGAPGGMQQFVARIPGLLHNGQPGRAAPHLADPGHVAAALEKVGGLHRFDFLGPVAGHQAPLHHGEHRAALGRFFLPDKRRGPVHRLHRRVPEGDQLKAHLAGVRHPDAGFEAQAVCKAAPEPAKAGPYPCFEGAHFHPGLAEEERFPVWQRDPRHKGFALHPGFAPALHRDPALRPGAEPCSAQLYLLHHCLAPLQIKSCGGYGKGGGACRPAPFAAMKRCVSAVL